MELNPYEIAKKQLTIVAKELNLDPNIHERLKHCQRVLNRRNEEKEEKN